MGMNKDFGPFELREKIGSGGMASVYLAVQKSLQRPVVLKILYPHLAEDEKLVQRFEREARAAAMMRHENIIQVIDCGRQDDVAYICMEFVEGMDLKKWLEAHGAPPIEMALLMLRDLCRGLEHAHGHRIIHRDIKPANIMLTPDGTIKIMDFGLARSGGDTTSQMTMVGSVLGTPAYMSPEQATGEVVDERSDIFSAGVVAYELLGGQRPFNGDSYSTVLRAILTVEPPDVTQFNPLIPEEVAHIVRGMLQKDVSKRYATIAQVRHELEGVIEQLGLHRGKDLLREYAVDPQAVGDRWRKKRLSGHLNQGLHYEQMGLGKIDDALLEFRRVLFLDPGNSVARDHLKKLEKERPKSAVATTSSPPRPAASPSPTPTPAEASPEGATVVLGPGQTPIERPRATGSAQKKRGLPLPALIGVVVLVATLAVGAVLMAGRKSGGEGAAGSSAPSAGAPGPSPAATTPGTPPQATPGATTPPATPAAYGPVVSPLDSAQTLFDAEKYADASGLLRKLLTGGKLDPAQVKSARELRARALVRLKQGTAAQKVYAELLGADPAYHPDTTTFTPADFGAWDAARGGSVPLPAATGAPAPTNANMATVTVSANPFASYMVDGDRKGQDLPSVTIALKPGHHAIRITHPSLGSHDWAIDVSAGESRTLSWDFVADASGSINVSSSGGWAEIYLDGDPVQHSTPWVILSVPPGKHEVSLVRDGYSVDGGPQTVNVKPGQQAKVSFKLKKK